MILCACGCGGEIVIKKHHEYQGIPNYINGHNLNTEENKQKMRERLINKTFEEIYGIERAKEIKRKISEIAKGRIFSKTHIQKMSESRKRLFVEGKLTPYMLGKHHSEETKKKMSESRIKVYKDFPELKFKISEANKGMNNYLYGKHHSEETKKKMSESQIGHIAWNKNVPCEKQPRYGKHHTEETKQKLRITQKGKYDGEKNPAWLGGKSFEPYTSEFNIHFKNQIRIRDNQICMNCGIHREKLNIALSIHHINYDKTLSISENCISLCGKCHILANINREYWTKLFQEKMTKLYDYKYSEKGDVIVEIKNV